MPTLTPNDMRPVVRVSNAIKTYGPTVALSGVTLDVHAGEVLGIVGHNGAGKSTLMRLLSGLEQPDNASSIAIDGVATPERTGYPGVRMAYQEGSLAPELTVKENVHLSSARWMPAWRWHGPAAAQTLARLQAIFPDHAIGPLDHADDLTLADRQRVEIARATLCDDLRVLILDEPTESLSGRSVDQLYAYVRRLRASGVAIILVSHRLREILSVCDRVAVMKDGAVVSMHPAGDVTEQDLLAAMGAEHAVAQTGLAAAPVRLAASRPLAVRVPMQTVSGEPAEIVAAKGEVIGLAGIAGQGQESVLARLWQGRRGDVEVSPSRAYVPGDRQRSGILPLWNVARNIGITAVAGLAEWGIRRVDAENTLVDRWVQRLKVRGGAQAQVTALSGGNQQKVIVARAFASEADTILLDDPFRGVDGHTKAELHQLIRDEAQRGRTIVWYSSENAEMQHCDRAYVLRAERIAGELQGADITDTGIIAMSFAEPTGPSGSDAAAVDPPVRSGLPRGRLRRVAPVALTLVAMLVLLLICGSLQPRIWSQGGLTLIMSPIVALAIAAMAQMVMMSIGDIDLGIGFFVGLVTALVAVLLRDAPLVGALALAGAVLAYACLGALVQLTSVPSLIATLGASFIWLGTGLFVLPVPGGEVPDALMAYAMWRPPLSIPAPIITMLLATALTWFVLQRTALGVRFRALGSNPVALVRSGASLLRTRMLAYGTVGMLGVLAGITLSAEIGGGDVNAVPGYTLTTVAAVVLGGGMFTGGRAVAWGTLFGAVTLGLLTVLLTLLKLSSNLQPAVQAVIVILVLAGRLVAERRFK